MVNLVPGPYLGVFLLLVGAGVGLPVPEELPILTGGALVGRPGSSLQAGIMLPLCIAGVVLSDGLLYAIGRWWGPWLQRSAWTRARLRSRSGQHLEARFREHGLKVLLFARLLPGVRSPIFIAAGVVRMPLARFLLADGLYAVPGVSVLFFLGHAFAGPLGDLVEQAVKVKLVLGAALLLVAAVVVWRNWPRSEPSTKTPEGLAAPGQPG